MVRRKICDIEQVLWFKTEVCVGRQVDSTLRLTLSTAVVVVDKKEGSCGGIEGSGSHFRIMLMIETVLLS